MVRFVDEPFVSAKAAPKISAVKWKMATGIGMVGLHFITLADNKRDLFDIYPAAVFKQRAYRKSDRVVIGVADGMNSAQKLIQEMIDKCLASCGDLSDVRGYYEQYIKDHT